MAAGLDFEIEGLEELERDLSGVTDQRESSV